MDADTKVHASATIQRLQDRGVAEPATIEDLQDRAETDRQTISALADRAEVDRALIAHLEAQGEIDREKFANLETALVTARRIGAAIGVLMASQRVTDVQAFDLLRRTSQNRQCKLRDVAEDVLLTGMLPKG